MINRIEIENFKSIDKVGLNLGRINVFIGENGAGKSNILEAIAFAGAASARKLDNEFLATRGIRVTDPKLMRAAFDSEQAEEPISIKADIDDSSLTWYMKHSGDVYSGWKSNLTLKVGEKSKVDEKISDEEAAKSADPEDFLMVINSFLSSPDIPNDDKHSVANHLMNSMTASIAEENKSDKSKKNKLPGKTVVNFENGSVLGQYFSSYERFVSTVRKALSGFIIYSPENSALRDFLKEGQILPLGINGEGLLKLLEVESERRGDEYIQSLTEFLSLFGWFKSVSKVQSESSAFGLEIRDRYICDSNNALDIKGANEGFLFLVFYFALFSSPHTPAFFAVDNIDASLNPKLCARLVQELNLLAMSHNKQAVLTTHNPAILDGLNLDDDQQRLFVISRDDCGYTVVRRVKKPKAIEGAPVIKLSEAFMRGSLGGLPKGF
ncbi:AAA family ATPase [Pseudomonas putida]|uniref:AAA family ATPase n=1 Tax=Pseudomonas putida TaxID=303 RepID=UPI0030D5F57E